MFRGPIPELAGAKEEVGSAGSVWFSVVQCHEFFRFTKVIKSFICISSLSSASATGGRSLEVRRKKGREK